MKKMANQRAEPELPTRWGPEKRLEFIDFRLRWDGRLNRGDISDFFGISTPQASLDISRYLEMAPLNAVYDRSERSYVATRDFQPVFPSSQAQKYLNDLLMQAYGILDQGVSFSGWLPSVAVAPTPARTLQAEHHDNHWRRDVQGEGFRLRAQQFDQIVVDDFNDLLAGRD